MFTNPKRTIFVQSNYLHSEFLSCLQIIVYISVEYLPVIIYYLIALIEFCRDMEYLLTLWVNVN